MDRTLAVAIGLILAGILLLAVAASMPTIYVYGAPSESSASR